MPEDEGAAERERLVAQWLHLTREVLPGMAAGCGWPIDRDHCFMRVCLDHAMGRRWDEVVARPAIRTLPPDGLRRAIAVAERIVAVPGDLPGLNAQSLAWRGRQRRVRLRGGAARAGAGTLGGV